MSLLLLLSLALPQSAAADTARNGAPSPAIAWTDLPADLPQSLRDSVRFGYFEVPQDHADPSGPRFRIAIAMLPAHADRRLPDPVVSIAGGPGLPAIALHMRLRRDGPHPLDVYRERRDLIVIDVRGHGFSEPRTCPELAGAEPLTEQSDAAERLWLAKLDACRSRLHAQGVRPETLGSVQAAHDLELLRRALGVPQLNLVGLSYGSRIAAEAVRQVPASIRAVYLSGPVPAGRFGEHDGQAIAAEVLGTLMQRCASQPECRREYPQLEVDYDSVMMRLRRAPMHVPVPRSDASPEGEVLVDGALMQEGLAQLLLNRQLAAGVPLLVHTLAEQGLEALDPMASQLMRAIGDEDVAPGTFLSFWCNDGVISDASSERLQQRCRTWLGAAWKGERAAPLRSTIPALIETGELDPRTPPSFAHFLAAGLPHSHVVILPWYGHERPPDCSLRISGAFFDAPNDAPDLTCLDSIPRIEFVTGVVASRWVGRAAGRVASRPWLAALPGAAALLLLLPVLAVPVRAIRAGRHGPRGRARLDTTALHVVAGIGLTLVLALAAALVSGMREHVLVPMIGVPADWSWLLVLPWLLLALTPVAAVLAHRRRVTDTDGSPARHSRVILAGATLLIALWTANALR